jgi:hypothetical protein
MRPKEISESHEDEWKEEAERLKALPREVQLQILSIYREPADNPNLSREDRRAARERVAALEKLLGIRADQDD